MEGLPIVIFCIVNVVVSLNFMLIFFTMTASREQKLLLLLATSNFIMNLGIGIEYWFASDGAPFVGMVLFFLGGSVITLFFLMAFAAMLHVRISVRSELLLVVVGFVFAVLAMIDPETNLFFKSVSVERHGVANSIRFEHNWLFHVYMFWHLSLFVVMLTIIIRCRRKTPMLFSYLKKGLLKSALCGIFAVSLFIISAYFDIGPDLTGFGCNLGLFFLLLTIHNNNLYPVRHDTQRAILDNTEDIIVSIDSSGGFEYANKAARNFFPLLTEFPYGQILKGADEKVDGLLALSDGDSFDTEDRSYKCTVLELESKGKNTGRVYWVNDITKDKQHLNEVLALKANADNANKAKSQFLANMSHEIRTPINAVLGMDEIILRETKEISTREYAKIIDNAGKTLLSLINDILDLSKIEAGKMELICSDYDVYAMLTDLIVMARFQADEKALELKLKVSEKLPKILYGDEKRVRQIITNIITNAIKYTEVGFVSIDIKCRQEDDDSVTLVVSVRDTGIGIKESDMKKLFGSFERIENETTHKTEGTGLGMSISTQLLDLMQGRMTVDSTFGEGSKFTLYIPQKIGNESAFLESKKHIVRTGTFTAPDADILIVDDNAANLAVATMLLANTKIRCDTVPSGEAFLEAVGGKHYDLIFLDYRMPGMDGIEAFKRFLEGGHRCVGVPVIMMTAEAENGAEEIFLSLGMNDYLSKPIIPALYESLIKKYLPPEKVIPVKEE